LQNSQKKKIEVYENDTIEYIGGYVLKALEKFSQKSEVTLSLCAVKPTGGLMPRMEKFVVCEINRLVSNCNNTHCAVSFAFLDNPY